MGPDHPDLMTQASVQSNPVRKAKTTKGSTKKISTHLLQRRVANDSYRSGDRRKQVSL